MRRPSVAIREPLLSLHLDVLDLRLVAQYLVYLDVHAVLLDSVLVYAYDVESDVPLG